MSTLSREHRRMLENTVAQARFIAEGGARKILANQYAVHRDEPWPHMKDAQGDSPEVHKQKELARRLRNQLRAHGRQLGDKRDAKRETQEIEHLVQACAYEHWHRMLFARFLADNNLLLDAQHGVAMTLDEVQELAREQGRDWMDVAAELAQRMLLAVFRPDDPVLQVQLPPETRQKLEEKLALLPYEVFQADDSLGWVYQFWQRDAKKKVDEDLKHGATAGADRIPPKTQLFTEDYMVLFLLENSLGAWWTAKRRAEGKDPALVGHQWRHLRLNEDGSPEAGSFDQWPRFSREIRLLDPCMGSGHFLVVAMPILVQMRMAEERLSLKEAVSSVLKENLFGLEIDARCSQIAAFNLALTAWRTAGQHFQLPEMNLACSGLGINASETDWVKLAAGQYVEDRWMHRLYSLFKDAPIIGSLIDPTRYMEKGQEVGFEGVMPLIEQALQRERSDERRELAIAAQDLVAAFRILAGRFTLVATNVPYLGRGKQDPVLAQFSDTFHSDAKADLATCFVDRCLRFCDAGGSVALVTPQNWLFLASYKKFRERLLKYDQWDFVARLGPHAFETITGEVVNVALVGLTHSAPLAEHMFAGWDVAEQKTPERKARELVTAAGSTVSQSATAKNPDATVTLKAVEQQRLLSRVAIVAAGSQPGQTSRLTRYFWEVPTISPPWVLMESSPDGINIYSGKSKICIDPDLFASLEINEAVVRGAQAWNRKGILVAKMRALPAAIYCGSFFDDNTFAIIPRREQDLPPIWAFVSSGEFAKACRDLNQKLNVTVATMAQVGYDPEKWAAVSSTQFTSGIPKPTSLHPTQWLSEGRPKCAECPLQIAVARLAGYHWPRQTGLSLPDCHALGDDGLEKHADVDGIVPLNAIAGVASCADRLRMLLADAYRGEWSAAKLHELLGDWNSLEEWLRDGFFEEHCRIFEQRPFIWHIWDGRKDGFHGLVNYHVLSAPDGEGGNTLEKLIYTYLGRWIERQTDEVRNGKEGADARLTAATHLKAELERILKGEKPYDIFVRWKPLQEQPIGWEPDINDGVRLNIRPWLTAKVHQPTRRDGCILRTTPRIPYGKDLGKETHRSKGDFPWLWTWDGQSSDFMGSDKFDGARWNDLHYSPAKKREAREKHKK